MPITESRTADAVFRQQRPSVVYDEETGYFQGLGWVHLTNDLTGNSALSYFVAFVGRLEEGESLTIENIQHLGFETRTEFLVEVIPNAIRQYVSSMPDEYFKDPVTRNRTAFLRSVDVFQNSVRKKFKQEDNLARKLWDSMKRDGMEQQYPNKWRLMPKPTQTLRQEFQNLITSKVDGVLGNANDDWISESLPIDEKAKILMGMLFASRYYPAVGAGQSDSVTFQDE
jgi:hypothetical protein